MKRVWGHVLAGVAVLGVGSALVFACVHNDSSIFIQNVLAPQLVTPGTGCTYTSSTTQTYIPTGTYDLGLKSSYDPWYLVGNQLVAQSNSAQLMTETSTFTVQGAVVRLTDSQGNSVGTGTFTSLTSGTIYPAVGGVPSYTSIQVPSVIDSATAAAIGNANGAFLDMGGHVRVITYVRFFGKTLGGKYIESNEFEFPVDVCRSGPTFNCLIVFSQADNNPCYKGPNCLGNPAATMMNANTVPCSGQDFPIDCAQCTATNERCRGVFAGMSNPSMDAGTCVP
jgi:hypothetical protein